MKTLNEFINYLKSTLDSIAVDEILARSLYHTFFFEKQPVSQPHLIVLGGGPGAGKTTYRKKHFALSNYHIHDMDEVLMALPDYQAHYAAAGAEAAFEKYWPTAQKIANAIVRFALKYRYNVIYDRTCGTETSYFDIKNAKVNYGYRISLYGFSVSEAMALTRVKIRAQKERRMITDDITKEYRVRFAALWNYYVDLADEARLIDHHDEAREIAFFCAADKTVVIHDAVAYQDFCSSSSSIDHYKKFPKLFSVASIQMDLFSSVPFTFSRDEKFSSLLTLKKLADCPGHAMQIATWIEDKWGYIRNLGIDKRLQIVKEMAEECYVVIYADQPIGLFGLSNHHWSSQRTLRENDGTAKELMYFYVHANFRNRGIGKVTLTMVREIANQQGATMVMLETLMPSLNGFYQNGGARILCGSRLFLTHQAFRQFQRPTTLLCLETTGDVRKLSTFS